MMTPAFSDRVAIVTGGASGIGRALSKALAERGAILVLADIDPELLEETVKAVADAGHKARASVVDVTDFEAVKRLVEGTVSREGGLDYIFNCAGIAVLAFAHEHSYEDWCRVLDVNLYGVYHCVAAAYPVMMAQGSGHIVNVASTAGLTPTPAEIAYTASKYGVVGLSHTLRIEGSRYGVKVSVVCPGFIDTPILQSSRMVNLDRDEVLRRIVVGCSTPEKCAEVIIRGVRRNKATITVTPLARALYYLQRISPGLVRWMMRAHSRNFDKARLKHGDRG